MRKDKTGASGFLFVEVNTGNKILTRETSIVGVTQHESILSPAAYSTITVQNTIHTNPVRNYDDYRNAIVTIKTANPNIMAGKEFDFNQVIYRQETRNIINNNVEQFTLISTDPSILWNAQKRMSNYYQCQTPSMVAANAFDCLGVSGYSYVESSEPTRDYQAANIHPFQVLAEQADVALSGGDPSFLHFATLNNNYTHYFRSVKQMTMASPRWTYVYSEAGGDTQLGNPNGIMNYEFLCDFDLLADLMNGVGSSSTIMINPVSGMVSLLGGNLQECGGIGGNLVNSVVTDTGTTDSCGTVPEDYMSLRQARLSLIQPDKIALKIYVPYNPLLHAGDMIECKFINKLTGEMNYGTGEYLIVNLQHTLKTGGYGISIFDLVSESVGYGVV